MKEGFLMENVIAVQVVGFRKSDWTNPENGQRYQSTKINVVTDTSNYENSFGGEVFEVSLPVEAFEKIKSKTIPFKANLVVGSFNLRKQTFKFIDIR